MVLLVAGLWRMVVSDCLYVDVRLLLSQLGRLLRQRRGGQDVRRVPRLRIGSDWLSEFWLVD